MPDVPTEVRQIAAIGLVDGDPLRVERARWPLVLPMLSFQRLTGIAVAGWEAGQLELEPEQVEELLDRHRSAMAVALALEQRLLRISAGFDKAGVRAVVIKGSAVAHTVYPDPSMRPFGDLDLLVSTGDWHRACEVLAASGYRRDLPEPRHRFDERFGKAATHSDADGYQVDLHRTLVLGPFGLWLDLDELLTRTEVFILAGQRLERLDTTAMLLNAALHAGLGAAPPLLLPLRDVAQMLVDPAVDWDRLGEWAVRWRQAAALKHAFDCTARTLGVESSATLPIRALEPRREESRAVLAYIQDRRSWGVALSATPAIPGVRAKAAYLFGLILPSREFLRARSGGRGDASYLSRWRVPFRASARRHRSVKRLPQPRG